MQGQMKKYTELLWSDSLKNEFMSDGHNTIPVPSYSPLPLDRHLSRKSEVLLMQMFYEQNLLNSFLFRMERPEASTSDCHCGNGEQTPYHLVLQCDAVDPDLRAQVAHRIRLSGGTTQTENTIALLNTSRDKEFMDCLVKIMEVHKQFVRYTIDLN